MTNGREYDEPSIYMIKVTGIIDQKVEHWLDGFTFCHEGEAGATLFGPVVDQAELHGLLATIRDLHLTLIYLARMSKMK